MKHTTEEIVALIRRRKQDTDARTRAWVRLRDHYNGDVALPWWDNTDRGMEELDPSTPALIAEAIDMTALMAAGVPPTIRVPQVKPGVPQGVGSREYADKRRTMILSTLEMEKFDLHSYRMYRHLGAYGTACARVGWTEHGGHLGPHPTIKVRDPINAYPDERAATEQCDPTNIGFITAQSGSFLRSRYGHMPDFPVGPEDDGMWDVFEWIDEDDIVIGILGRREPEASYYGTRRRTDGALVDGTIGGVNYEISRRPNTCEYGIPVVAPRRITLDQIITQMDHQLPNMNLLARLMRAQVYATEKAIAPDLVLESANDSPARITSGEWKDGRTGQVNTIVNGQIRGLHLTPDPAGMQMISLLERTVRVSTGSPAIYSGDNHSNLRTGNAIDALRQAATDPRIQELHSLKAHMDQRINEIILDTWKVNAKGRQFSLYASRDGDGIVEVQPEKHVETIRNTVRFPVPGMDIHNLTVVVLQLLSSELISIDSAREMIPWVFDTQREHKKVQAERLERAALSSLEQGAIQGGVPPLMMAEIIAALYEDEHEPLHEAMRRADQKVREMQAAEQERAAAAAPGTPDAQAGLGAAPEPSAPIPEPPEGINRLRELGNSLRATARPVA